MGYALGLDLGTTFTAAAIHQNGRTEMVSLGNRASVIPSLVFLREDEEILVGDAAERRGSTDPRRLAREFKRRMGDSAPIMLGSSPYSAERIMAALMRDVVDTVTEREGGPPDAVAITHPANWGPYKTDLLRQAADLAGLRNATLLTEPIAAALHYASTARVDPGSIIAVYDLGGGTFDAAVVRKTADGFEQLGDPEGIERLGGIDFDEAVFRHVRDAIGEPFEALDQDDPAVRSATQRLRQESVEAKEALSSDTDASIPVLLPGLQTEIRVTRPEFESMVRPTLRETVDALRRAIASADITPADLHAVLLVGGSSRIPLVSEMVSNELGRPVAVDAHPKHAVALGAALVAARAATAVPGTAPGGATGGSAAGRDPGRDTGPVLITREELATPPAAVGAAAGAAAAIAATPPPAASTPAAPPPAAPPPAAPPTSGPPASAPGPEEPSGKTMGQGRTLLLAGVAALVVAAAVVGGLTLLGGNSTETVTSSNTTGAPTSATVSGGAPSCESASGRCAFIEGLRLEGDTYVGDYSVVGFEPIIYDPDVKGEPTDHHVHFYFDTVGESGAGTNGTPPQVWAVWDRASGNGELVFDQFTLTNQNANGGDGATQLCVSVADAVHGIEKSTGNCLALPSA